MPFRELEVVRVVRLLTPTREVDGTAGLSRQPRVGDVGSIVHVLGPHSPEQGNRARGCSLARPSARHLVSLVDVAQTKPQIGANGVADRRSAARHE
jgi:hypothetical protein